MDGTIYIDTDLIDGTLELLKFIKDSGGRFVFVTNNSSKSIDDYIIKLSKMGIKANFDNFFTSAQSTVIYIKKYHPNKKVYCMGTRSLIGELEQNGINVVSEAQEDIDIVLLGYDTELKYQKLVDICAVMTEKTIYLATNPDFVCPAAKGHFLPDCGAMSRMLEYSLHRLPKFIGKPEVYMINDAMQKFGNSTDQTVLVGDRLYTDIASGENAGVDTICVLSGEATLEDIDKSAIKPTYIFKSVKEVLESMEK